MTPLLRPPAWRFRVYGRRVPVLIHRLLGLGHYEVRVVDATRPGDTYVRSEPSPYGRLLLWGRVPTPWIPICSLEVE